MTYRIEILKRAQKFIAKQPRPQQERLLKAIFQLPDGDVKPLKGSDGLHRLRVGDYRIVFTVKDAVLLVTVVDAGNRGQLYNQY